MSATKSDAGIRSGKIITAVRLILAFLLAPAIIPAFIYFDTNVAGKAVYFAATALTIAYGGALVFGLPAVWWQVRSGRKGLVYSVLVWMCVTAVATNAYFLALEGLAELATRESIRFFVYLTVLALFLGLIVGVVFWLIAFSTIPIWRRSFRRGDTPDRDLT